jgi:chemotaxis protein methyltransferase WspC
MAPCPIEALLSREIGLRVESIGRKALDAAIAARMKATGAPSRKDYEVRVIASLTELHALIEEIVVSETWFFRDEEVFTLLATHATRTKRPFGTDVLRVLSLPCASGEEPYSVAITLLEAGFTPSRFSVKGVDINGRALEAARRGVYGKNSFRGAQAPGRMAYFEPHEGGFRVVDAARQSVEFVQANVLAPGFSFRDGEFDVVFCRNLLIYLDQGARSRVLDRLCRWLGEGGIVFGGHAEAFDALSPRFHRLGTAGSFAYGKRDARPDRRERTSHRPLAASRAPGGRRRASVPALRAPSPPEPTKASRAAPSPPTLDAARTLADKGDLAGAKRACTEHLAEAGATAEAYALLGVVQKALGDVDGAIDAFTKAVYLDHTHHEALTYLALLAEQRGDASASENYRRRADRARTKGGVR